MTLGAIGGIATVVAIILGSFSIGLVRYKNDTIETYKALNEAHELKTLQMQGQISELTGRVNALQSTWASHLAEEIADAVALKIAPMLQGGRQ